MDILTESGLQFEYFRSLYYVEKLPEIGFIDDPAAVSNGGLQPSGLKPPLPPSGRFIGSDLQHFTSLQDADFFNYIGEADAKSLAALNPKDQDPDQAALIEQMKRARGGERIYIYILIW